jgi:hypothetical protein
MPDLNHVIDAHTSQMQEWWRDPEYIRERKAFIKRRPVCDRCGRPATTPGHSHEDYRDFETYLNAVKTDKCDALCSACNKAERAGRRPCPSCVENYKKWLCDRCENMADCDEQCHPVIKVALWVESPKIHYITQLEEICRYCQPGYNKEAAKARRKQGNRIKRELNQGVYVKAHPFKKAIVGGKWVTIKR